MPGKGFGGTANFIAQRRGNVPILKMALGLCLVAFFLMALMLEISASESFLLHGSVVGIVPNWAVLRQPVDLVEGNLGLEMAKAVLWGWGIELIYLVCVVGEVTVTKGRGWFRTGAIILIAFNFWTDVNYGNIASGFWGQIAFSGITAFIVAFFGVIGLNMIFSAMLEWND